MPDWLLDQIFSSTRDLKVKIEAISASRATGIMNSNTLKLIGACLAGSILGYVVGRLTAPFALAEETAEPEKSAEPERFKPLPAYIELIDTTNPFNNKKFNPILDDKNYVIGFMYKKDARKMMFPRPAVIPDKLSSVFNKYSTELLL